MQYILGFIFSYLSAVGFAMLFSCPKRSIGLSSLAGALGFLIYMLVRVFLGSYFTGIVGEIFARKCKMPAILFIVPGMINLVPGKGIYNTLFYFVDGQKSLALVTLFDTMAIALAISFGILLASVLSKSLMTFKFRKPSKKHDWRNKK